MNRRDDCAGHCPHKGFSDRAEYQGVFPREENPLCGQGASKGASAFMNSPGQWLLPAQEEPVEFCHADRGPGRPAVIALIRPVGCLHFAK